MREPTFLLGLAIAGMTIIVIVRTIAGAFTSRRTSGSDVAELKEELEEAQRSIADQGAQIAELHNRLDFAERMLAQRRERTPLGPGDKEMK